MAASFLYACDLEVPLKGASIVLLKRLAVLLSWLPLSSSIMEEMSSEVGAAATSDDSRLPMNGIVDEWSYLLHSYNRRSNKCKSVTMGEVIAAITVIFCSKPHMEGVQRTKNVGDSLNATEALHARELTGSHCSCYSSSEH